MSRSPAAPIYAKISGPIVMVGFGSIGKGTLPLIERHLDYDKSRVTVLDPKDEGRRAHCEAQNVRFIQQGVTRENYRELLTPLLTEGSGQAKHVTLVYPTAADVAAGRISVLTPVGAALIGLSAGQSMAFETPSGEPRSLTVLEVGERH